jgi:SAM-dependent methyltransferase
MLDLLSEAGIESAGVDLDAAMVARARAKGHEVELGNALSALEARPDGSLGAIFSAQVIEHIPAAELGRLLELSRARLRPGGLFVAETVNPHCVNALKAFWVDPTHEHPLFPETMLQMLRAAGFKSAYFFHPNASGNVTEDRFTAPAYAVVGRAGD